MKKTAQELGDQELLTNIEDKLRHALAAKAESRPWGAQMDSALANLEKAKLQTERAQEKWNEPKTTCTRHTKPKPKIGNISCDAQDADLELHPAQDS